MHYDHEFRIEVGAPRLMDLAQTTAEEYLRTAIGAVDKYLGKGAAKNHPELIAAYMQAATIDFVGNILAQQIRCGLTEIAEAVKCLEPADA